MLQRRFGIEIALQPQAIGMVEQQLAGQDHLARQFTPGLQRLDAAALEIVGLLERSHHHPNQLSGGQQQRVAIARALVKKPLLVLADEPTANLDSDSGAAILDLMERMNERHGTTFVFSTHDPMVMERARRLVRLHDGAVASDERRNGGDR